MSVVRCCAVIALTLGLAGTVHTQTPSGAPTMVQVTTVVVKPSMVAEYEDFAKKVSAAAAKIGMTQRTSAYQVTMGTRNYTYLYATRVTNWAELDRVPTASDIVLKAHGEAEGGKLLKAGRAAVESSQTDLSRYRVELSTNFRLLDPIPALAFMVRTDVKPDMVAGYEEYLSKLKAAQEQASNHPSAIRISSVQGVANQFVTVQYHNKYAERDTWPAAGDVLRKALGEAEARRLTDIASRAIAHREFWELRYRADLSRGGIRTTSH